MDIRHILRMKKAALFIALLVSSVQAWNAQRPPRTAARWTRLSAAPQSLEFTQENVDKVLDEVRPYLISDGGNIKVVGVDKEAMSIQVELEGACGSCPSSTTTMKMGVERVLKEKWPEMAEVVAINETAPDGGLQLADVEATLAQLAPAIKGLGGEVEVLDVNPISGEVGVSFKGPEKLRKGIEMALKDNEFIKQITFYV